MNESKLGKEHLSFKGSIANAIAAMIFCCGFFGLSTSLFVLGIREFGNETKDVLFFVFLSLVFAVTGSIFFRYKVVRVFRHSVSIHDHGIRYVEGENVSEWNWKQFQKISLVTYRSNFIRYRLTLDFWGIDGSLLQSFDKGDINGFKKFRTAVKAISEGQVRWEDELITDGDPWVGD